MIKIFSLLKNQAKEVVFSVLLLSTATLANLLLPAIMSKIVNNGINAGDMSFIIKWSLIMLAVAVVGVVAYIIACRIIAKIVSKFSKDLSTKIYQKTLSLTYDEFSSIGTSALLTRSTEDIFMVREMAYAFIGCIATVPTLFIGGVILSFKEDVALSAILFALIPILIVIVIVVGKKIMPRWEKADKYIDSQNELVRERMNGIRVIRAYNKEPYEHLRLADSTKAMADNIIKANTVMGLINPVSMFILNSVIVLIAYVGAVRLSTANNITAGSIIAVIQYVGLIMVAVLELSYLLVFLPKIKVSCNRMNEVLDMPESVQPIDDFSKKIIGNIEFNNVEFAYKGAVEPAITGINMSIKQGETVAIIGGTGSGKSTILNVLLKFNTITKGDIVIDGMSIQSISSKRIRDNIAVVMQKSVVLNGTIAENIKMGKPDATYEEMIEAARIAQLAGYVDSLSDKYEHMLDQGGTNISGGQKQRIAIARAVIKNAPIYIFDDSFSALDFLTEANLRKSLNQKLTGKTQIIITQRVATAMSCDKIYVLDKGKIVGQGKHRQLIANCPVYKEIYDSQIGGDLK